MLRILILACGMASLTAAVAQRPKPAAQKPAEAQPLSRATFLSEMDSQFRKMDADKNGQLTRVEIEQFEKLAAVANAEGRNREQFIQLDTDKSGQLSAAEFKKLVTPPPPASAAPMIAREDRNRDQQVSLVEHRTATLANFDRIDADKDGVVTATEMKAGGINPR